MKNRPYVHRIVAFGIKAFFPLLLLGMIGIGCDETYEKVEIKMQASFDSSGDFPSIGGSKTLNIESNTNKWNVSSSGPWLTIINGDGKENGKVTIQAVENKNISPLNATITIRGTGFNEITHHVEIGRAHV